MKCEQGKGGSVAEKERERESVLSDRENPQADRQKIKEQTDKKERLVETEKKKQKINSRNGSPEGKTM